MNRVLGRLLASGFVGWVGFATALTSCSSKHQYDDDDNGGASGQGAAPFGHGGSGARASGGSSSGGKGATGSGGTSSGGDAGSDGDVSAGGAPPGSGGDLNTTGGSSHGTGGSSHATGGSGANGDAGANDVGAAGACTGSDCGCTGDCPVCGDGHVTGSEACDDGNALPFDGCSPDCQLEPGCADGGCVGTCGDGIVVSGEDCDDGNTKDGDGCSSACVVEKGYSCSAAACDMVGGSCVLRLPAVFRDFNAYGATGGHPDFQPGVNSSGALQGLVEPDLDADGKPVLSDLASPTKGFMHGKDAFAEWYRDGPPSSGPIPGEIVLWDDGANGYVNRWGKHGEQWIGYPTSTLDYTFCTSDCATCGTPGPGQVCLDKCTPIGGATATYACIVNQTLYDGNPLFFPIDSVPGILTETRTKGRVPEQYGWAGWPWESDVATDLGISTPIETATAPFPSATHNFSFTTEVKFWFRYDSNQVQELSFLGDDDVWVFLNGHLAVDLGGWHVPLDALLRLNNGMVSSSVTTSTSSTTPTVVTKMDTADAFGLEDGKLYQIAVFHAEREVEGSSFKLGLHGLDVARSTCVKN